MLLVLLIYPSTHPGALTPFGDLHNYLPPPPPFKPDILKGLQHRGSPATGNFSSVVPNHHDECSELLETQEGTDHPDAAEHVGNGLADAAEHVGNGLAELNLSLDEEGNSATQKISLDHGEGHRKTVSSNNESETSPLPEMDEEDEVGDGHFDADDNVYRLISRRQYKKGQEVFLCYGRHTNLELLEHYGFMLDDNPHGAPC